MSRMQDQLKARIRDVHKMVRRYDDSLKELKAYFDERPSAAAQALLLSLPEQLEVLRQYALSRFGVDLEDREQRQKHSSLNKFRNLGALLRPPGDSLKQRPF